MSKKKYKYNPQTLSYEEVSVSIGMRILRLLLWIAPSIIMGLVFAFLFSRRLDSPNERLLKGEIDVYVEEITRLNTDMNLINKVLNDIEKRDEDLYRVALYADEFPKELRAMGTGGSDKYSYLDGFSNADLLTRTSDRMDRLEQRLHGQSLSFKELLDLAKNKEKMLSSIPSIQPVNNKNLKRMASGYGYRIDPIYKTRRMHTGMDFTAKAGTDIYATGDGVIEVVETSGWGYGKSIVINHGYGYRTRYAHLSSFKVKQGQKVKRGELIGLIGNTGKSTGPHLHYEVEKGGKKLNPVHYYHSDLTPAQYEKLIEMSQNSFKSLD
jgi:murein DD-endopeptidase MepM/ murein hydrolase activator NlpD